MTKLEIHVAIGNLLSFVNARLLLAGFGQVNVVEHAHEDDPVWKMLRRGMPLRGELSNPSVCSRTCLLDRGAK